ncbi:uncharacterized protein LOC123309694 [Coccinella septempunctata]|uniref:uncharacterized protein LOC123309694 n=1 Tax=Coccinella septempunctata TaxID=41139 RepID=UPI001D09080C|nr:uncharacterized protein LOC123309694 [Coccinella septempunctata]
MKAYVSLIFIVLSTNDIFFSLVYSLECQYCSSGEYSSDCREGTVKDLKTCTLKGEDHCYVEYILNKGQKPFYRRGCAPGDWCKQQRVNHGAALKFCNTCQGSNCNNETIGSKDSSTVQCISCKSGDLKGECKEGTTKTYEECEEGSLCLEYYVATTIRNDYTRGCGEKSSCTDLKNQYSDSLEECRTCKYELCNNNKMTIAYV